MAFLKNKKSLLYGLPHNDRKRRKVLLDIAEDVLSALRPENIFQNRFSKASLAPFEQIVLFSIGKAARAFASAVIRKMPQKPDAVYLADTGHPFPSLAGMQKTKKIIAAARELTARDLCMVLLSGGGSSMLTLSVPEISLEEKVATTKALLACGAPIQDINVVRKHLSEVKGGRLAALVYPATVWGFVISDVPGNDLSTIASGPLSPDPSTFESALEILKKYKVKVPDSVKKYLEKGAKNSDMETPKLGEKYFNRVKISIVADHWTAAEAALTSAQKHGLQAFLAPKLLTGECAEVARKFVKKGKTGQLLIACGETTVTCHGSTGYGGRNQEFALSGLQVLKPHQTLLALATDGVDGICPESIAGVVIDKKTLSEADGKISIVAEYLRRHDSYSFFQKVGGQLKTGRTSTNLGDLILLLG